MHTMHAPTRYVGQVKVHVRMQILCLLAKIYCNFVTLYRLSQLADRRSMETCV